MPPWLIKDWFFGFLAGTISLSEKVKERLGGLLLFVCSGQSGRKGIESCLKMKSSLSTNLKVFSSILFVLGQGRL